ncbi:MFS transporter [Limobrevibacterium gyesilva]|uniref:MFS transporter n=1 Tax=Limobrevibacterium gyesilva TaxID=2991712 RepID=A0AA42CCR4_9PROT|nr:MFS transporter [Limobrevibacterium gyesilva]MCW3473823.1 MFS transporter [Limobrevibacterium gyesilva]
MGRMVPAKAAFAGLCSSLVGIGLARFAYTPLIPVLIGAAWFSPGQAAYLGAANLAGYLAGALLTQRIAARVPVRPVLRGMMLLVGVAFLACAIRLPFAWFFAWRFAAGFAGGVIMILAAPAVLASTPAALRGRVGGFIFTGVGLGVAASGTLVPLLLEAGIAATWCVLGALSLVLTALCWRSWPDAGVAPATRRAPPARSSLAARAVVLEYGLNAVGVVPHMVFLVDFVARGLGRGIEAGAGFWVLYGFAAIAGPMATGWVGDRAGFGTALRLGFVVQAAAVILPILTTGTLPLAVSCIVMGAFTPGIVPLVLGRLHEFAAGDPAQQRALWGAATASFALFQAAVAYGLSFLFAQTGGAYAPLFAVAAAALALALAVDVVARAIGARQVRTRRSVAA